MGELLIGCFENASHFREGPSYCLDYGQAVTGCGHVVSFKLNILPCGTRKSHKDESLKI
jgi:hypothetical protein